MRRLPFTLGLFVLIGVCVLAQQATEFQTDANGAAAIALPAGTWEFVAVTDDPEIVVTPVIRTVDAANPDPEPIVLTLGARGYWCTITVVDTEGNPMPGVTVSVRQVAPE